MGTNYIAPTWRQPENLNKDKLSNYSITYDGNNDYITVDDNIFSGLETWSMAGFYNLSTLTSDSAIFGKYANSPQQILLYWDNPLGWRLLWKGSSTGDFVQLPSIATNEWHFIAVTYDGTTAKMYLDDQVYTYSVSTGAIVTDTGSWQIGADGNSGKDFNGKLGQLSFYDYAIGPTEISYLRNGGNPLIINGAEPIAYYPLGDNSNPTSTAGYPNVISAADSVFDFTSNGYITLPTVPELGMAGASNYTTNIWINRDSTTQEGIIGYNYANPQGAGWYLWANGTTLTAQLGYDGGTTAPYGTWKYTIPSADFLGSWHMITMVFDGSQTGQDRLKVYYDGVEPSGGFYTDANLFPSVLPNGISTDNKRNVYLGVLQTGTNAAAGLTGYLFNGQMSNAEFWKDSLTSAEVLTLYNNGLPLDGGQPEADKLRAWYKLNQSAILTPGQNAPSFSFSKVGFPDLSGGDCYVENVGGVWQLTSEDMNCDSTNLTEYVILDSREILGTETSAVVRIDFRWLHIPSSSSTTGVALDVSTDGGAYTNLLNSFGSGSSSLYSPGGGSVFVPGEWPVTYSSSVKLRLKIQTGQSNGCDAFVKTLRLTSAGGTILYDANFSDSANQNTGYRFSSTPSQPTSSAVSADKWDIPDNRSAYPRAFAYPVANQGLIYDQSMLSDLNQIQSDITVSCWVKTTVTNTTQTFLARSRVGGPSKDQGWVLGKDNFYGNGGYITFTVVTCADGASGIPDPSATAVTLRNNPLSGFPNNDPQGNPLLKMNDGKWHLVSGVYDRSENRVSCYIDGVLQNTKVVAGLGDENMPVFIKATSGGSRTTVGGYNNGSNMNSLVKNFKGEISNVKIWDTALSTAEVVSLYNNGFPLDSNLLKPSSLKAWWKLDNSNKYNNLGWASSWNIYNNAYTITDTTDYNYALAKGSGLGTGYIQATSIPSLDITSDTTISIWIKGDVTTGTIALTGGVFGAGGDLALVSDQVLIRRGSSNYKYYSNGPGSRLRDGNWHHILMYSPGYAQSDINDVRLFMDGQEILGGAAAQGGLPAAVGSNLIFQGNVYTPTTSGVVSNAVVWNSNQISQLSEIYNNGSPAASYTNNPIYWVTLENDDTAIGGGLYDKSGNSSTTVKIGALTSIFSEVKSKGYYALSKDLVESDLLDDNVSTVNAESNNLPSTALVQSDITRKLPFSIYSYNLDGASEYWDGSTSLGNYIGDNYTGYLSISIWFNPVNTGDDCGILQLREVGAGSTYDNLSIYLWNNFLYVDAQGDDDEIAFGTSNNNTWNHLLCVFHPSGVKLYLNGQETALSFTYASSGLDVNNNEFWIGNYYSSSAQFGWNGFLQNCAVWDKQLDINDALKLYNNGVTQNLKDFRISPIRWWALDENSSYWDGTKIIGRELITGDDIDGINIAQLDLHGNGPGSIANGVGSNITIASLKGDMQNSTRNSYSINMADYADGVTNPADSGRSTNVP
jgi:hypothetical protein